MSNQSFAIKEYGRTELALLYCPEVKPDSAWKRLRRWMEFHPTLMSRLHSLGYNDRQRSFTPLQTAAIVDALGEP